MPEFTVIIPTYNWSAVLPYSIGSVLRQSMADLELLVVGDGCTDDSERVVNSFEDRRLRWINLEKNMGTQVAPNNEGNRQATGRYVAYLGHDDLWMPGHLDALHRALESGVDFAYSGTVMVVQENEAPEPYCIRRRTFGIWIPPTSLAHSREAMARVGGWRDFRTSFADAEVDLLDRAQAAGLSVVFVPRLTAIKLPAASRKDVYRQKPHHEQELWFGRIGSEPNLENELATDMVTSLWYDVDRRPYGRLLKELMDVTFHRVARRMTRRVTDPSSYKAVVYDRRRAYKGLDPID